MTDSKDAITTWEGQVEEFKLSSLLQSCSGQGMDKARDNSIMGTGKRQE